jgi:multiple sugar transport system permease protein
MVEKKIRTLTKNKHFSDTPFPWLLPLVLVLGFMFLYPTFEVLRYGFTDASILRPNYSYTLKSYKSILGNPVTYGILSITFIFVFFSVIFQTLLGLIVALAVDKGENMKLHGTVFVRVVTLLSWAIPGVIVGVVWGFMYNETGTGILVSALGNLGIHGVSFLTDPKTALVCVIVANIWRGSAQSMILSYAGLKTIGKEQIEASAIDGVTPWQRLIHIILPNIFSVISTNIILNTIMTFNTFDMVLSLTGGGPGRATEVLAMTSYNAIFKTHSLAKGSVYATLLLVINSIMALIYFRVIRNRDER